MNRPPDQRRHTALMQDSQDPFAELGAVAHTVQPSFSQELHDRLMRRISKAQPASATSTLPTSGSGNRNENDLRPPNRSAFWSFPAVGTLGAIAASLFLLFAAWWLWMPRQESRLHPQVAAASQGKVDPDTVVRDAATASAHGSQTQPRPDHEDLTAAINYLLALGNRPPRSQAENQPQTSVARTQETPWLKPSVSPEMLAFEIDQQHLEHFARTLFALR